MSPYRRFVNSTVTTTILLAFGAMVALQPRAATAQQTKPATGSAFSFAAYGDSRPMMYLPLKEGQPDASKLFVEMFGLVVPDKVAADEIGKKEPTMNTVLDSVTALDILLEPDATMLKHAEAANARLLSVFPKGFSLDATHRPHVTMAQRFVRTADLDKVYAAAGKVFAGANVTGLKLEAFKYYYIPDKDIGLSGIVVKPTPELLKLQQNMIDAVAPFTVTTGTSDAFVTTPDDPVINPLLIQYVAAFVPMASGEHFNPHVTTGVASREYLDKMLAEPFEPFTFSPAGAAVYQLGQFGTAAKKLWDWTPQR